MRCKNAFQVKWTSSWNLMEAILAEIKHVWKQKQWKSKEVRIVVRGIGIIMGRNL
jgi:hypothetical protein